MNGFAQSAVLSLYSWQIVSGTDPNYFHHFGIWFFGFMAFFKLIFLVVSGVDKESDDA